MTLFTQSNLNKNDARYTKRGSQEETDKDLDEKEFSDGMDGYSFWYLRMLICQMTIHFSLFSPLFKKLAKTEKQPSEIIEEFWDKVPEKHKWSLQEYTD